MHSKQLESIFPGKLCNIMCIAPNYRNLFREVLKLYFSVLPITEQPNNYNLYKFQWL